MSFYAILKPKTVLESLKDSLTTLKRDFSHLLFVFFYYVKKQENLRILRILR